MAPDIVVLGRLASYQGQQSASLFLPFARSTSVDDPDLPWPGELRSWLLAHKGLKRLRGSAHLPKLRHLACVASQWVLRRSSAEEIVALLPAGDALLIPAPLCDTDGHLDGDWVLLDVRARHPLGRDAALFTPTTPGAPHASLVASVEQVRWSQQNTPRSPLFRVSEAPELLCAHADTADRIRKLLGTWVVMLEPPYDRPFHQGKPCEALRASSLHHAPVGGKWSPPIPGDEAAGRAAAEAYFRLARGAGAKPDRAIACASPVYAYHLARTLDGEPRADTRAGALRHPRYATLYARDVDRGPRDDTRAAALAERTAAHHYLAQVERARHPAFELVLGAANIESMFEDIPALRATASPPPERFPATWISAAAAAATAPAAPKKVKRRGG